LLVEFLDEREDVTFFVDILRYSEPDPRSPTESELTRYTSMDTTCDRCEERCELLVISLSMDHDICVAFVARDHDLEYRDDPMSMFIVTGEGEYFLDGESADTFR
jgi:hypothetical protein